MPQVVAMFPQKENCNGPAALPLNIPLKGQIGAAQFGVGVDTKGVDVDQHKIQRVKANPHRNSRHDTDRTVCRVWCGGVN